MPASPSNATLTIFIVDDDREMRSLLGAAFEREGFRVCLADSGGDLLAKLDADAAEGRAPGVVISDICMPGINGLELLRRIRRSMPSLPVILITAFGDRRTHERARSLGATAVLDKPFRLEQLRAQVHALIG